MALCVRPPARGLQGTLAVPGDKSIGHRALLLGALAEGTTTVTGFSAAADVRATLGAVRMLGAPAAEEGAVVTHSGEGCGFHLSRINEAAASTKSSLNAPVLYLQRATSSPQPESP